MKKKKDRKSDEIKNKNGKKSKFVCVCGKVCTEEMVFIQISNQCERIDSQKDKKDVREVEKLQILIINTKKNQNN